MTSVSIEKYPLLYSDEQKEIRIREKNVSIQNLIYYDKISLSKEKLFDYLDITEEELACAKDFLKTEIGVSIYEN